MPEAVHENDILTPYLPRLALRWLTVVPEEMFQEIEGSIAFVDLSGFTKLSERLAKRGKVGAEEIAGTISSTFTRLLAVSYADGGHLIKFGGDALLLLFTGPFHPLRAARSAVGMRSTLRAIGPIATEGGGSVRLRMSCGVHSGRFHFFLVGDEHRELIVTGGGATQVVVMEQTAEAGEIVVSPETVEAIPARFVGPEKGPGRLLRTIPAPTVSDWGAPEVRLKDVSPMDCVPVAIRRHLLAGGSEPEHRPATVAFLRFEHTDELCERDGGPAVAERLHTLVSMVQAAATEQGVTFLGTDVDKDGGKILLVAGAPSATGSDEERMLLTVRRIMDESPPFPLRIGVNRGHVFAGDIGPRYRRTYTVMGDTTNLAARLMGAAEPGTIITTRPVLDQSRTRFEETPLPPFNVKGKAKPIEAFVVGAAIAAQEVASTAVLPLAGRDEEMSVLLEGLDRAHERSGSLIRILGEPGIGKTRLVEEVRARAKDMQAFTILCEPYTASTAYFAFRTLLRTLLGIRTHSSREESAARLHDRVEANSPQLLPWLPLLGDVIDVALPPTPETLALDERFRRARLEQVAAEYLETAIPTPALIVFEDVQFMDEASAELLESLAKDLNERPWLIVTTARTGEAESSNGVRTLVLAPLDEQAATTLAEQATDDAPLQPHELRGAVERSGGNPLYLRELLMAVSETGLDGIPGSVETLVTARIDRLPPHDRAILRSSAVLGTAFPARMLASALDEVPPEDDPVWGRLSEFMRPERGFYRFTSALIRDAAYEGLTYRRRKELHAKIGDAICAADNPEDQAEFLALHFFHAQRFEECWRFARLAGDRAQAKFANVDAAGFYSQALEAARRLRGVEARELVAVMESLGDARKRAGDFRKAHEAYRTARKMLVGDPVGEARLLLKQGWLAERLGRYAEELRWIQRGLRALEGCTDEKAARQRSQLTASYATTRQSQGNHRDAIRWSQRAIAEAQAAGDRHALAQAHFTLDWAYTALGMSSDEAHSEIALEIYEELDDLPGQSRVLNNKGAFAYVEGRWNDAIELYERGRIAREKSGDPVNAAYGTINIGEILSDQGRLLEAESLTRQALRVWKAAGDRSGVAFALSQLGRIAARDHRYDDALALYDQALAGFADVGDKVGVVETEARIAECLAFQGESEAAIRILDESEARHHDRSGALQGALTKRIRGYALMQLRHFAEARAAFDQSVAIGKAHHAGYEVALTLRALSQLAAAEGTPDPALEAESAVALEQLGVVTVIDPIHEPPADGSQSDGAVAKTAPSRVISG